MMMIFNKNCKGDLAVTFGEKLDSEFVYNYFKVDDKLIIESDNYEFRSNIYGDFNFSNLASSITIGKFLDLTNDEIQKGLDYLKTILIDLRLSNLVLIKSS